MITIDRCGLSSSCPRIMVLPQLRQLSVRIPSPKFPRVSMSSDPFRPVLKLPINTKLPLIHPNDHFGNMGILFSAAALNMALETTRAGNTIGPLASTIMGFLANYFGIISPETPVTDFISHSLLSLTIPLLLFRADIRAILRPTLGLCIPFFLSSAATTFGAIVASFSQPGVHLDEASLKANIVNMGLHSNDLVSGGLVVAPALRLAYFAMLFTSSSVLRTITESDADQDNMEEYKFEALPVVATLATSIAICRAASYITDYLKFGSIVPVTAALSVALATAFPGPCEHLAHSGAILAKVILQVFFVIIGAQGNLLAVNEIPRVFSLIQVAVHFAITLGIGKLVRIDTKSLVLALMETVGGHVVVCRTAARRGWQSKLIPGILAGILVGFVSKVLGSLLSRSLKV